jgi:hypothetical protein
VAPWQPHWNLAFHLGSSMPHSSVKKPLLARSSARRLSKVLHLATKLDYGIVASLCVCDESFGDDAVFELAEIFHFGFDDVTGLEPPGRLIELSAGGDPARRAGG